jgi:DNA-binding Xre family transcriptional regulator
MKVHEYEQIEDKTKLQILLINLGITQRDLKKKIDKMYPDFPISISHLNTVVKGRNMDYKTSTVIRICGALNVSPNDIIEYE